MGSAALNPLLVGPTGLNLINVDLFGGTTASFLEVFSYTCATVNITQTGTPTGSIIFEQSNDNATWFAAPYAEITTVTSTGLTLSSSTVVFTTSATRSFLVVPNMPFLRARISVAFTGSNPQAYTFLNHNMPPIYGTVLAQTTPVAASGHSLNSAASTNATSVKTVAGTISSILLSNFSAATKWFKLYNKISAPTVGTDIPISTIAIPANSFYAVPIGPQGMRLVSGIAYAITGAQADTDTTAVAAGDVKVHISYN